MPSPETYPRPGGSQGAEGSWNKKNNTFHSGELIRQEMAQRRLRQVGATAVAQRAPDTYRLSGEELTSRQETAGRRLETDGSSETDPSRHQSKEDEIIGADLAQRSIEAQGEWSDGLRGAAVELNQADPEATKLSHEQSLGLLEEYQAVWQNAAQREQIEGAAYTEHGSDDWMEDAAALSENIRGSQEGDPGATLRLLQQVESELRGMATPASLEMLADDPTGEARQELERLRGARDALFTTYENQMEKAGDAVVRQAEDVTKAAAVDTARGEIDAVFGDNATESTAETEVQPSGAEAEKAWQETLALVPDDPRKRIQFEKDHFQNISKKAEELQAQISLLTAYAQKRLMSTADRVPEGAKYPDTNAAVMGNGGPAYELLRAFLTIKTGKEEIPHREFGKMPFSEVASQLGLDVNKLVPDYEARFRMRQ